MAIIRRLLSIDTQYKYPLLRAPIILTSRKYTLSADESWAKKHRKFFKDTFGVDANKNEKASLKNAYRYADLFA